MLKTWVRPALVLLFTLSLNLPAFGWYSFGHMAVAEIAYKKLTPRTRERVDTLLKLNPYYQTWLEKIPEKAPPADRGMLIFMFASTWPDDIKVDKQYNADGLAGGDVPDGSPECAANTGYVDKRMHKYWHYDNVPFSTDGSKLPPRPTPNARTQIDAFRAVLASAKPDELKSYDLTWLIHLVGDVHEPLHSAERVCREDPGGDKGGNDVKLTGAYGDPTNLHSLWDGAPGTCREIESVLPVARRLPEADPDMAAKTHTNDWIEESFNIARNYVYTSPIGAGLGPFTLTPRYEDMVKSIANRQVALAGARLANTLNNELK